ncbi:MAG: DMT family transporter [Clostridium sp.]|nr:DMT family transporter [Prevotella sp.]MCM1428672.1 DMT family transporter [Clostridium sp.]MCM1475801.1 DMT family transporter [Muribaculaceae bacterium]
MTTKTSGSKYLKLLGHIGAIVTVGAWGTSFISTKVLMEDGGFSPIEVYVYRFTLAYIILLLFTFKKLFANNWRDELQFFICGICAGFLYFITENYALKYTTTGNVSLLSALSPIFTTILMAIFYRTRVGNGVILGSLTALVGVACIVFSHGGGLEFNPLGDFLALSSALCWAIYAIVVKGLMPNYTSLFITRKIFIYGVLASLPMLFLTTAPGTFHLHLLIDVSQPTYLFNFLFLAIMCSLGAFIIWNEAMKILGPVTANNYIYAQPLVTMIVAYFILGESITMLGYIGCILIIGGLIASDKVKIGKDL